MNFAELATFATRVWSVIIAFTLIVICLSYYVFNERG